MTPRERVLAAIHHEEPDRVPLVLGVSNATGIKMKPYKGIKEIIGVQAPDNYIYDWPELGTAEIDPHTDCIDSWGSGQTEITPGHWFPSVHPLPLARTVEELEAYQGWPDMSDPTRIAHVRESARRLAEENQYAILATPWLLFPLERAYAMQGMEAFLLNMAMDAEFVRAFLEKIATYCKELMGLLLQELGDNVDMIKIGDDLGTQNSLVISPKMYREILKPVHADFISFIKSRTKAKIFFHSCGDVAPLIEDFIEIGVDILNPVQASAGKMSDFPSLKKQFGKNIVFCGGIDTHRILPFGTVDEVRSEVRRVIQTLGPGGGYMVGAVHTVMDDVPPENVLAMVDAVEEFGRYPIR
jgi:uroporphyrinogen decarboxylase